MTRIFLLLALLTPGLSQAGGSIVAGGFDDRGIEIHFAAADSGIDLNAEQKLLAIVVTQLRDGRIVKVTTAPEGFEGDITYCLEFRNSSLMSAAFPAVDDLVGLGRHVSGKTMPFCK